MTSRIALLAVLVLLAFGGWWAFGRATPAPGVTVTRLDGTALDTRTLRGRVVLVNFWATTCSSCVKEMPQLVATHRRFAARGYETLAVAMAYDNPAWVRDFTARSGLPFTVVLDADGSAARAFGEVRLTPTSFLIDREGRIVQSFLGEPDWPALHARIDQLLGAPS